MKKLIMICCVCFCVFSSMAPENFNSGDKKFASLLPSASDEGSGVALWIDSVYSSLQLDSLGLKKNVFFYACKGYQYLLSRGKLQKTSLLTICDYTQSSTLKRLYVIDMQKGEVLYNTYVSHGKNSGSEFATSFSNKTESHKSSLGFMITGSTYLGKAGYSMYFEGLEKGINSNVRARAIVMHGSNYVDEKRADEGNVMGRSFGCPAVPYRDHRKIIDAIKDGSCFFAYADDKWYATSSGILKAKFNWPAISNLSQPENDIAVSADDSLQPVTVKM
jgi:hypothetical protein